jgi:predicted amidophosphoribosyltransferase
VCWCCRAVSSSLGPGTRPSPIVVPVALCRTGDPLHAVLRGYKDARVVAARRHFRTSLGAHLGRFLSTHDRCITEAAGSAWDSVAIVPSAARPPRARARVGAHAVDHPLGEVVRSVPCLSGLGRVDMRTGRGTADHLAPSPDAFEVGDGARGRRVLLLDDTWVTGARARSAAASLHDAGAHVVAVVVAGRSVGALDAAAVPAVAQWWRWAEARAEDGRPSSRPSCAFARCLWARPG